METMDPIPFLSWPVSVEWTLVAVGQILAFMIVLLISLAFLLLLDRKVWASVQMRKGPNVVGAFGLLQSFADFLKFVFKEIVVPAGADRTLFLIAPLITFILAFIGWAVVPVAPGWVIADLNVGILYLFAISSLGVYGIIIGGWASNSKYPFLGALRSAAQMVSYEVSIGFIIVTVLLFAGSMNLSVIVEQQAGGFWNWNMLALHTLPVPMFLVMIPMTGIFFISALAETNRPPFDLARSGIGTRGRVSGGIFLHPVSALHDRRISQHRSDVRHDDHPLLWRMACPVRIPVLPAALLLVCRQGDLLLLHVRHGEGAGAALPL